MTHHSTERGIGFQNVSQFNLGLGKVPAVSDYVNNEI